MITFPVDISVITYSGNFFFGKFVRNCLKNLYEMQKTKHIAKLSYLDLSLLAGPTECKNIPNLIVMQVSRTIFVLRPFFWFWVKHNGHWINFELLLVPDYQFWLINDYLNFIVNKPMKESSSDWSKLCILVSLLM